MMMAGNVRLLLKQFANCSIQRSSVVSSGGGAWMCGPSTRISAAHFSSLQNKQEPTLLKKNSTMQEQQPSRKMSRVKHRTTHRRHVWPVKRRERQDEELSSDNRDFIKQVVLDQYGPAAIPESTGMPFVSPLKQLIHERGEWKHGLVRTGVIAKIVGQYLMWSKEGKRFLSTLVQVVDNHVVKYIPPETVKRNYGNRFGDFGLLMVGAEGVDPQMFTKEYCGLFAESGLLPKLKINRFTISPEAKLQAGTPLYASHFQVGQFVDIRGKTIERGFQGVMKRWGFHGMPATHGCTKSHRRGGNTGAGGEKGRRWPGTKMPGHMGSRYRILRGVEILRINTKYNVIYLNGPIPGEVGHFITIRDTFFYPRKGTTPVVPVFPTYYPDEAKEPLPDDIFHPQLHTFNEPTITFAEQE